MEGQMRLDGKNKDARIKATMDRRRLLTQGRKDTQGRTDIVRAERDSVMETRNQMMLENHGIKLATDSTKAKTELVVKEIESEFQSMNMMKEWNERTKRITDHHKEKNERLQYQLQDLRRSVEPFEKIVDSYNTIRNQRIEDAKAEEKLALGAGKGEEKLELEAVKSEE